MINWSSKESMRISSNTGLGFAITINISTDILQLVRNKIFKQYADLILFEHWTCGASY